MRKLSHKVLFILAAFFSSSAIGQIYFNKSIPIINNQSALSVQEISTGGYLIAGQDYKSTMQSLCFMRVDINGDTLWIKEYGLTSNFYYLSTGSLHPTSDGNYICAGSVTDTLGNSDALLIKLTVNGDTLWTKRFGGPFYDAGRDCQQTIDGGLILIAENDSLNDGLDDFILIKMDSSGNQQWKRRYNAGNYEVPICGFQTQDKGYIISGGRDLSSTNTSNWIVKTDSLGIMQWNKTYGSGGNDGMCWITQLNDGTYITTGAKAIAGLDRQACIRKLHSNGTLNWEKLDGGISYDAFYCHVVELSNSYVFFGDFYNPSNKSEAGLLKTDTAGNQIWKRTYFFNSAVNNYTFDMKKTSDNGFIISGQTVDVSGDAWLVKIDSNGCEIVNCNVGINELSVSDFKLQIYPIPASSEINILIEGGNLNDYLISIINILGEEQKAEINKSTISISDLASGVYFISAQSKKGQKNLFQKFIKE